MKTHQELEQALKLLSKQECEEVIKVQGYANMCAKVKEILLRKGKHI